LEGRGKEGRNGREGCEKERRGTTSTFCQGAPEFLVTPLRPVFPCVDPPVSHVTDRRHFTNTREYHSFTVTSFTAYTVDNSLSTPCIG